jgi:hypothetical protein
MNFARLAARLACLLIIMPVKTNAQINRDDYVRSIASEGTSWGRWSNYVVCPPGQWAMGYAMKVEPPMGEGDDTAANAVELYCGNKNSSSLVKIKPHNGYWGKWGQPVYCPLSRFMTHFRVKVEARQVPGEDDTSVNSVMFKCEDGSVIEGINGGPDGTWREWGFLPAELMPAAICGLRVKVESPRPSGGDDTALNQLEFAFCKL